ncbi:hypothetical protein HZ326_12210 [Fusarium oxysporum f. sp. albedinis]|nr:hypothetical protein HZ326_12210 [Fusarium oxysporum f. sp. albedinis]
MATPSLAEKLDKIKSPGLQSQKRDTLPLFSPFFSRRTAMTPLLRLPVVAGLARRSSLCASSSWASQRAETSI